jgi:phosphohistidine swiveling domain-containing protein
MTDILYFDQITDADEPKVGGKGLGLAKTARAGLPVPAGFVVTTDAYRAQSFPSLDAALARLGDGPFAVRSSATAEDAADTSFAGQQETYLGVRRDAVADAVRKCWASLFTDRAVAYRVKQGVDAAGLAMAVVVQLLVPAEVAGVLFTRDPRYSFGRRMLAEASWGLGEAVVSGRVTPDQYGLDFDTGAVIDRMCGRKDVRITAAGEEAVPPADHWRPCLSDSALSQLAELGRRVEAVAGAPRDIEWAFAGGAFFLLQARPITVGTPADREWVHRRVITDLRAKLDPRGTVWVRYNLSEVLPRPTPMTWEVVSRLIAADGGFGMMNADFGAPPDPTLGSASAFDLVAGRPMMNLARAPRMQGARPPFRYPLEEYKADPRKALDPKPKPDPLAGRGCLLGVLTLPRTIWKASRMMSAMRAQAATFAARFTGEIVPEFVRSAEAAMGRRWDELGPGELVLEFENWRERTLVEFARHSLKPTAFADLAWSMVFEILKPRLGEERARAAVGELSLGAQPPAEANVAQGVRDLASGAVTLDAFLERFGHRCTNEMELSQPRWRERPAELDRLVTASSGSPPAEPRAWELVADEAKLTGAARVEFRAQVERLRTYLGLREAAKHYLLMGYAVIRRALVELDRRNGLNGGLFFLNPHTLRVFGGDFTQYPALREEIAQNRKWHQNELSLDVPPVLFGHDLDAIGRPQPEPLGGDKLEGVALSAGVAEGPALVLTEPTAAPPESGYILVCPSTDPAWVPLFTRAAGLVMETGGVLSHGAIVAREFGLPAVASLPGATRMLKTGQRVRVDGGRGTVTVLP